MRPLLVFLLISICTLGVRAQGTATQRPVTIQDALSAQQFRPRGLAALQWDSDSKHVLFIARTAGGVDILRQPIEAGEAEAIASLADVQQAASAAAEDEIPLGVFISMKPHQDGGFQLDTGRHRLRITLDPLEAKLVATAPKGAEEVTFCDTRPAVAYVMKDDVFVRDGVDADPVRVTFGGNKDLVSGKSVSRVEFGIHNGLWWSPDGKKLALYREDFRPIAPYPYIDHSETPAKLVDGRYPMAGQAGSVVSVGVFDVASGNLAWLEVDPKADDYLTNVTWHPSGARIMVAHVNRGQDKMTMVEYDATTGRRLRVLFTEEDDEWVEPEDVAHFLPDNSGRFLWLTYRTGYRHIHLHDQDGMEEAQLTSGNYDVSSFLEFSKNGDSFYYTSTGENPLEMHVYEGFLDGSPPRRLTHGRGRHQAQVSPDGSHVLDIHNSLELPLATDVLKTGASEPVRRLHEAPNPAASVKLGKESLLKVKGPSGDDLHVYMVTPPDMEEGKRYPVIHYIYAGPHSQLVTDSFMNGGGRWGVWLHAMANRGYVCFMVDGRGTLNRGIEWQQAIHRRLGTLEVEDQIAALDHILSLPFTDPERVGVTGWSYGGFMTLSLMTRAGDRYKAGVSGAPVTDWRYYETGYGERYMDRPEENKEGYDTADPSNHLDGLKGRLLVVQGTRDATVMWQSSLHFLDKCIDANKNVDYMAYPGQLHGLRGSDFRHFLMKMTDYFDVFVRDAQE